MASKSTQPETTDVETTEVKTAKPDRTPLSGEQAKAILAVARPALAPCLCGCGELTKGRFYPGHDATLKSDLHYTAENGTKAAAKVAREALEVFGW